MAEKLTLLDMFKNGTATWSSVSSFVVVLFWCVGCWLSFLAIVNYKNAADGKSGIAKPIIQTVIASLMVFSFWGCDDPAVTDFGFGDGNASPASQLIAPRVAHPASIVLYSFIL